MPETIVSDNGTQFTSEEFRQMCEQNGIQHIRSAPYHPQSNGRAERFVDTLKRGLRKVKGEGGSSEDHLNTFLLAYRSTPSSSLENKSPDELFLGRKLRTTLSLLRPVESMTAEKTQASTDAEKQFNRKHGVKKRSFHVGDSVMVRRFVANHWQWFSGKVLSVLGKVNYDVQFEHMVAKTHANQMRLIEPANACNGKADEWLSTMLETFGTCPRMSNPSTLVSAVPVVLAPAAPVPVVAPVPLVIAAPVPVHVPGTIATSPVHSAPASPAAAPVPVHSAPASPAAAPVPVQGLRRSGRKPMKILRYPN